MAYLLSGERPAAAVLPARSRFRGMLAIVGQWVRTMRANRARRIALASLLELSDARLEDLGISRLDIAEAVRAEFGRSNLADCAESADEWLEGHRQ